jgi:ABC-type phosphate/phosphonate transport system substrate-binding protein
MMGRMIRNGLMLVSLCVVMISCGTKGNDTVFEAKSGVKASSADQTLTIKLAINDTYCKQTACACIHDIASREYFDIQKRLKADYNIDLQLTYFMEPYEMEDAMKEKKFDGVISKPWNAFMLADDFQINYKRIADVLDVTNNQWLTGTFIVKKDSDIKTMEDMNGRTFLAGQADAYEKYHSAFRFVEDKGIKPGRIYQKASCLECINELIDNKTEVAVVSDYVMKASCAVDIASPDDFRIIGETERMPLCSVILDLDKVSDADALRLQAALLDISGKKSPESMLSDGFVLPASWIPVKYSKPFEQLVQN